MLNLFKRGYFKNSKKIKWTVQKQENLARSSQLTRILNQKKRLKWKGLNERFNFHLKIMISGAHGIWTLVSLKDWFD